MDHVALIRTRDRAIYVFIFAFVLGILVSSFYFIVPIFSLLLIIVAAAVLVAERIWKGKIEREIIFVALALIAFGCGSLRFAIKDFHTDLAPLATGVIVSEPEKRDQDTRFVFKSDNGVKALVSTDMYSAVEYGNRVEVEGKWKQPGVIEGEDGRDFDYDKYLSKDDIYYTSSFSQVTVLDHNQGNKLKHLLLNIKRSFVVKTKEILPEPESSLLAGLIISGKDALPSSIIDEFRRAGVVHIVVLSGYNITIIAEFMKTVFRSSLFSIFGIILFVIMTGGSATVVRAALMALVVVVAKLSRRQFSAPRALLIAAFVMLLENPKILVYDPSFHLSFFATAALIFFSPLVEKWFAKLPEKFGLKSILVTTISTQIIVLPYLIYSMGDFSLVSLPTNMLILFFIPVTMLLGFGATLISYISTWIALPLTYISHILLAYILAIAHFFGNLRFSSIATPPVSVWIVVLIYIGFVITLGLQRSSAHKTASSH